MYWTSCRARTIFDLYLSFNIRERIIATVRDDSDLVLQYWADINGYSVPFHWCSKGNQEIKFGNPKCSGFHYTWRLHLRPKTESERKCMILHSWNQQTNRQRHRRCLVITGKSSTSTKHGTKQVHDYGCYITACMEVSLHCTAIAAQDTGSHTSMTNQIVMMTTMTTAEERCRFYTLAILDKSRAVQGSTRSWYTRAVQGSTTSCWVDCCHC